MKDKGKGKTINRVPIVAILGHVDHGKTTILDRIREANVQACEAGGITQKISVFTVSPDCQKNERITFVDTPGHEAFDLMRLRGGNIADIVLLIIAGNDGVKPQTKESIEIIKNSTAKPIVVVNKCDIPGIDFEKIKRDLSNEGLMVEGMGGDIPLVKVSAKTGDGITELLEMINLIVEMEGLEDEGELSPGVLGKGIVLESVKDKSRGNVSTVIVTQGCFKKGQFIAYENENDFNIEKIKGLVSEEDCSIDEFNTGCGGKVIGLSNLLSLGSEVYILEKKDKKILDCIKGDADACEIVSEESEMSMEDLFETLEDEETEEIKELPILIKASSEGSLEALETALEGVDIAEAEIKIIDSGVGDISIKDLERAEIAKAIILGFEVSVQKGVEDLAKKKKVVIRTYDIIYKLVEEISDALETLTMPESAEEEIGKAVIKEIFTLSDGQKVLGNRVREGIMKRDCKTYIVRDDEILVEGKIKSLKINKNDVKEASKGMDCGIILTADVDAKEGDEIYCYKVVR